MQTRRRPWWSSVPLAGGRLPSSALLVLVAMLALILVVAALTTHGVHDLPPAQAIATPVTPGAIPVAAGATPLATTDGGYIYTPTSGHVRVKVAYRLTILTHCGLDWPTAVDFDGSFWDLSGEAAQGTDNPPQDFGNPPPGFGNPMDTGVMTLVGPNTAIYRSEHGSVVQFQRHPGPRVALPCF